MPTAVPERIAVELVTRLSNITTGNGYNFSVSEVVRPTRRQQDITPKHLQIQVKQAGNSYNASSSYAGSPPAMAYDCIYNIQCFVRDSDDSSTATATTEYDFEAAVKKAVCDSADWHTFGGLSVIADWGFSRPFLSPEGDHAGVTIPLIVTYRVSETDPYTVRA